MHEGQQEHGPDHGRRQQEKDGAGDPAGMKRQVFAVANAEEDKERELPERHEIQIAQNIARDGRNTGDPGKHQVHDDAREEDHQRSQAIGRQLAELAVQPHLAALVEDGLDDQGSDPSTGDGAVDMVVDRDRTKL